MNFQFRKVSICLLTSVLLGNAWAGSGHKHDHDHEDKHEHRHHDSHEHGVAELNLAVDGTTVVIELESPAANIVGFEHKPHNQAQRDQVKHAIKHLEAAEEMFLFSPAAKCKLDEVEVETELAEKDHNHDHGHHHDENIDEESHSEFSMSYSFTCKSIDQLKSVDVKLFSHFEGMEEIKTQVITPHRQGLSHLTPTQSKIDL